MQELRNDWLEIPEARRGGGDEELVELLLDKVSEANEGYVSFVRAAVYMRGGTGWLVTTHWGWRPRQPEGPRSMDRSMDPRCGWK